MALTVCVVFGAAGCFRTEHVQRTTVLSRRAEPQVPTRRTVELSSRVQDGALVVVARESALCVTRIIERRRTTVREVSRARRGAVAGAVVLGGGVLLGGAVVVAAANSKGDTGPVLPLGIAMAAGGAVGLGLLASGARDTQRPPVEEDVSHVEASPCSRPLGRELTVQVGTCTLTKPLEADGSAWSPLTPELTACLAASAGIAHVMADGRDLGDVPVPIRP